MDELNRKNINQNNGAQVEKAAAKGGEEAEKVLSGGCLGKPKPRSLSQESSVPREQEDVIIQAEDLSLWYGDFQALKEIQIAFNKQDITALIGPSGCGKSTFLKCLNRMNDLVPGVRTSGKILYQGENILSPEVSVTTLRKDIGMVFQKPNPFPMSIYDNVAYGPRIHGMSQRLELDERVEQALKDASLWDEVKDRLKKSALGLSGGQQQRLCIARALAVRPEVLLLDEATSALDPVSTRRIEELLLELKEKYTLIMVTHQMQQAVRVSDKTAFFLAGELVEYGTTDDLFSRPTDKRTEAYVTGRFGEKEEIDS